MAKGGKRSADSVSVCVRVRPMNSKEKEQKCANIVEVDDKRGVVTVHHPRGGPDKVYTFDRAFDSNCKQTDVYNLTARPVVESVLEGYNGTIFAYGQTGTGKTYTMEGDRSVPEKRGIIPNSFAHIFGQIAKAEGDTRFLVRCSYLEIYCENIVDLLGADPTKKLPIKESPDAGVYVKDLCAIQVQSADELDALMTRGNNNRKVGATKMNEHSSRSHAIFTILVERSETGPSGDTSLRMGKLNLVDLAGSERQTKTQAEGQRLQEANKINWSLTALGNVISQLVDGKSTHIPYRDSKLTRLLQDSLGGNAKTTMFANFGPADYNFEETIGTLRYADRAKQIKNKPKINEDPKDALLREYLEQIEKLKAQLGDGGLEEEESGSEEDSSDEEEEEEGAVGWDGTARPKKGKKGKKGKKSGKGGKRPLTPSKVKAIQEEIDRERAALQQEAGKTVEEKAKIEKQLRKREAELDRQRKQRDALQRQMDEIQSHLVVGGVNLLDKAQEQEQLLEEAQRELEARQQEQSMLAQEIDMAEAEHLDLNERYSSLEEERDGKTRKLKKIHNMYLSAKSEKDDIEREYSTQLEAMDEVYHELEVEMQLHDTILDAWIPAEYRNTIEELAVWNEEIGDWQIPALPHTGNNILKTNPQWHEEQEAAARLPEDDMYQNHYFSYNTTVDEEQMLRRQGGRSRTSRDQAYDEVAGGRPVTARPVTARR